MGLESWSLLLLASVEIFFAQQLTSQHATQMRPAEIQALSPHHHNLLEEADRTFRKPAFSDPGIVEGGTRLGIDKAIPGHVHTPCSTWIEESDRTTEASVILAGREIELSREKAQEVRKTCAYGSCSPFYGIEGQLL